MTKIWVENGIDVDPSWNNHIAFSYDNVTWQTINKAGLGVYLKIVNKNTSSPIAKKALSYTILLRHASTPNVSPALEFDLADIQSHAGWLNTADGLNVAIAEITDWLGDDSSTAISTILSSVIKAEDSVHVSGDNGIMALAVRNEGQIDMTSSDRDYAAISVDRKGNLIASSAGKMTRIMGAEDYSRAFTYHGTGTDNIITIVHTGTTPHGLEKITETISYVDPAVNGSNVTDIVYS